MSICVILCDDDGLQLATVPVVFHTTEPSALKKWSQ